MSEPIGHTRITRDLLREWGACYSDSELDDCFGDFDTLTLLDVLDLPIPMDDRIWVFEHALPAAMLAEISCCTAELVLPHFESKWPQSDLARKVIERQCGLLRGEVSEPELTDASAALVVFLNAERATGVRYTDPAVLAGEAALSAAEIRDTADMDDRTLHDVYADARSAARVAARIVASATGGGYMQQTTAATAAASAIEAAVQQIIRKFIAPETTDGSTPDAADHADDARGLGPR
jgi:hypothetical protein